uniref:Uncharacterized protein n=1 Tax=Myotis myotis TaxID=51298 RepID=A0A7J7ZY02_MYOMY|nr:hypothetical protein mMyoMyo1_009962 [Myotis myotis]
MALKKLCYNSPKLVSIHWDFDCVNLFVKWHITVFTTFFIYLSLFPFQLSDSFLSPDLSRSFSNHHIQHLPFFPVLSSFNFFYQLLHFLSAPDTMIFIKHHLMFVISSIIFHRLPIISFPNITFPAGLGLP